MVRCPLPNTCTHLILSFPAQAAHAALARTHDLDQAATAKFLIFFFFCAQDLCSALFNVTGQHSVSARVSKCP